MLRDVRSNVTDGLLGFATATGDGLHIKIGVSPSVTEKPITILGSMGASTIKSKLGLSPLAGVPMGTRAGDIDTCVAQFIMDKYNMTADECLTMLNKKSGVLALSNGVSSDFRDLEAGANKGDEACQLALDKFCYEVRKYIGAYAAALGGLDCLVFTAGVGENGCTNRAAICEGLEFLGVKLDPERNKVRGEEALISADDSRVKVWVIPTNEELMIAQDTAALCGK